MVLPPPRTSKLSHRPSDVPTCFCFSIALDKTNNNNGIIVISPVEDWNELVAELRLHTVTLCWFGTLCYVCGETALGPSPVGFGEQWRFVSLCWTCLRQHPSIHTLDLKRNVQDNKSQLCQYPHPYVLIKKRSRMAAKSNGVKWFQ